MLAFSELPFNLPGNVFRSVMPYGSYDPHGELLDRYRMENITTVVVLAEDSEMLRISGKNLIALYQQQNWRMLHMPVVDFAVPDREELNRTVTDALKIAGAGEHIVIHCSAGIGRTGLFAACMAKQELGMTGEQAIAWVRQYIPNAVETESQRKLVIDY